MAFATLGALRALLNTALGTSDADVTTWKSTSDRNEYLRFAFRRLWPIMGRMVRETITPTDTNMAYTLASIEDIVDLVVLDLNGLEKDRIRSWTVDADESADPIVRRVWLPQLATDVTVRVVGFARYTVPTNNDASTCDLPPHLEHVVVAGGVAYAYKAQMNDFMSYKQRASQNPVTQVQLDEVRTGYLAAEADFTNLMRMYQRNRTAPKRATTRVR